MLSKIKKILISQTAATMVEVLLAVSLLPVALATSYLALDQYNKVWSKANYKAIALSSARYLVDRMGRDLRQAERPFFSLDTSSHSYIVFKANLDDQPGAEEISYTLEPIPTSDPDVKENGEQIIRRVYQPDMSDPNHPKYDQTHPSNEEVMARIVRNNKVSPKIPLFSFYRANGVELTPSDTDTLTAIKLIKVDVQVKAVGAPEADAIRFHTKIRLRNY